MKTLPRRISNRNHAPDGGIYQRQPRNAAEGAFFLAAKERGWTITKRGWPDFFCFNTDEGKLAVVEVKRNAEATLRREQQMVMRALARYGVPCFFWSPDGGFKRITGDEE